jgi:hypothetical protein
VYTRDMELCTCQLKICSHVCLRFVELLAVPTTLCDTMIKVTIKYLQKGMRGRIQKQRSERRQAWIQELHRKELDRCQVKVS